MGKINWKHVFLIGLILGVIETMLQLFNAMLFAGDEIWDSVRCFTPQVVSEIGTRS